MSTSSFAASSTPKPQASEPVPANDFKRQWEDVRADSLAAVEAVGASGWYILGEQVRGFEQALANWWGLPRAVGVASGLDAIEISLRELGCREGDKVLTTPMSAFATTLASVKLGAVPVFTDTDQHGLMNLAQAAELLASRRDIRFLVPVHLYGLSLNLDRLEELKRSTGVRIVEDCAQSIGATHEGRPTGSVGEMAATSFYPTKNLGAMGDGGAILTASAELAAASSALRDYGQSAKYQHDRIGYNSRLDELQAALLSRVALPRLTDWTARRREIAARYTRGLEGSAVRVMRPAPGSAPSWHLYPVWVAPPSRDSLLAHLKEARIGAGIHYPVTIPDQPALRETPYQTPQGIGRARELAASQVSLPIHPYLTHAEVDRVIEAVRAWRPPR